MFYTGVIEDRLNDPLKLGRCRVRIIGLHSADKQELPTEDLPWASIMQPINSAATSGIGISPTGLVEGAYVIVIFQDEYQQQPIIIGSIAGIQAAHKDQSIKIVQTSESAAFETTDGSTKLTKASTAPAPTGVVKNTGIIKKPTEVLFPSEDCYDQIRREEKLSSLTKGINNAVAYSASVTLDPDTPIYPYLDTSGVWTIGWGSTYLIDNSRVTTTSKITKQEADELLVHKVLTEFAPGVLRNLSAPVTQAMYDALVAIAYNTGVTGLTSSAVMAAVNAGDYQTAASHISILRTNGGLLEKRRLREKALFQRDGFPRKDMTAIDPPPNEVDLFPNDITQNPVVTPKSPGIIGTDIEITRRVEGFRDPNGVYPKTPDEPDVNRLARHEKIDQTIVFTKEAARAKDIKTGGFPELGEKTHKWTQPKIPYNARYPYNHVHYSERGHIQEIDDTEGSERLHTYHRAGTYEEIDKNGTKVNRIVGDHFEILERNGHVLIKGTMNVTIMGNSNVRIENDSVIDVLGDVKMTVGGNVETGITGDYKLKCEGAFVVDAGSLSVKVADGVKQDITGTVKTKIKGDVSTKITGNTKTSVSESVEIGAVKNWRLHAGTLIAMDAADLAEQSGLASDVPLTLSLAVVVDEADALTMGKGPAPGVPEFPEITAPSRHDSDAGQYETPEDGDPAQYEKKLQALGASTSEILTTPVEVSVPEIKVAASIQRDCSSIPSTGPIDRQFRLSPNLVLADLDKNNALQAAPVVGLSKAEIVCNLKSLAENCLEQILALFPSATITSGYRNYVPPGGAPDSDHLYGAAADIVIAGFDRAQHYAAILQITKVVPAFTQLILEYRGTDTVWIHVAFNAKRGLKMETLTMNNGKLVKPFGSFTLLG